MAGGTLTVSCGDQTMEALSWRVSDSVWMYSAELYFTVPQPLLGTEWTWVETGCRYITVFGEVQNDGRWQYMSYPYSYWQACSHFSEAQCGVFTVEGLCQRLSLPYASPHASSELRAHQWVLGGHRCQPLIDKLCMGAACTGGGCSTLHYTVGGELWYADLAALSSTASKFTFIGNASGVHGSVQSEVSAPSNIVFIFDGDSGVGTRELATFGSGSSVGGFKSYIASDSLKSIREWSRRNAYGRGYYRAQSVEYRGVRVLSGIVHAGCACTYADGSSEGMQAVCVGYRSEYSQQGNVLSLDIVVDNNNQSGA